MYCIFSPEERIGVTDVDWFTHNTLCYRLEKSTRLRAQTSKLNIYNNSLLRRPLANDEEGWRGVVRRLLFPSEPIDIIEIQANISPRGVLQITNTTIDSLKLFSPYLLWRLSLGKGQKSRERAAIHAALLRSGLGLRPTRRVFPLLPQISRIPCIGDACTANLARKST